MKPSISGNSLIIIITEHEMTHNAQAMAVPAAVGCGKSGGALLQVPRLSSALGGAAHRNGVNAGGVTVTGAVVLTLASVT